MRFTLSKVTGSFEEAADESYNVVARAATAAMDDVAAILKNEGRASIAAAGFGSRWQNTWKTQRYPKRGVSVNAAVYGRHKIGYSNVFEEGAVIKGRPFLWLPTDAARGRVGRRGKKITPALLAKQIPLRFARGKGGQPMLVGELVKTRRPRRRKGSTFRFSAGSSTSTSVVLFVGLPLVTIPKKFNISAITEGLRSRLGALYFSHLEET